jgi:hypothetical protein
VYGTGLQSCPVVDLGVRELKPLVPVAGSNYEERRLLGCSLMEVQRYFGGIYCPHPQGHGASRVIQYS